MNQDGRTIRDARFKLIAFEDDSEVLFDLDQDPLETRNLLAEPLDAELQIQADALRSELARLE